MMTLEEVVNAVAFLLSDLSGQASVQTEAMTPGQGLGCAKLLIIQMDGLKPTGLEKGFGDFFIFIIA